MTGGAADGDANRRRRLVAVRPAGRRRISFWNALGFLERLCGGLLSFRGE